jgi:hypothetical protein
MRAEAAAEARRNEWIGEMRWVDHEFEGEEARVWRVLSRGRDEAGVSGEARARERACERAREGERERGVSVWGRGFRVLDFEI